MSETPSLSHVLTHSIFTATLQLNSHFMDEETEAQGDEKCAQDYSQ